MFVTERSGKLKQDPVAHFWRNVTASRLLSPGLMAEIRRVTFGDTNPVLIAEFLVSQGILTRWQADQLMKQRTHFHLGPYKLMNHLHQGSLADVYQAEHQREGGRFALKIFAAPRPAFNELELTDASTHSNRLQTPQLERIRATALALTHLRHETLVRVHEVAKIIGQLVLVMEHVDGTRLNTLLASGGPMPIREACQIARRLADGLQRIHECGIAHGRVRTSRVLIEKSEPGAPKLLVPGTNHVATDLFAPLRPQEVQRDLHGVGTILCEMLAGRSDNTVTLEDVDAPYAVKRVADRLTSRDPEKQFESAQAAADALEPLV